MKNSNSYWPQMVKSSLVVICMMFTLAMAGTHFAHANGADEAVSSAIPCNNTLALSAAKANSKVQDCAGKALSLYPNRVLKTNVVATAGCSTTIRGCTYTIYVYLTFPCPSFPCLAAPDIAVATVDVDCMFNVTNVDCHI